MARSSTARRYAEAAFGIAERDGTVDRWLADLDAAAAVLGQEDAMRLLASPAVPLAARQDVARRVLGERVAPPARNLVFLLLRRGRIELLPAVAREYRRLNDRRAGISHATVTSAAPLDDAERGAIAARLASLAAGRVEASYEVDPALLGGVTVRLGDRLIDGSVLGRLERLRNRLAAGAL